MVVFSNEPFFELLADTFKVSSRLVIVLKHTGFAHAFRVNYPYNISCHCVVCYLVMSIVSHPMITAALIADMMKTALSSFESLYHHRHIF